MCVAGSSPAVPRPSSASSCYLVRTSETCIMLDCGHGAVASARRFVDLRHLDAVVISHMHPDHVFDLVPLRYALAFAGEPRVVPLFVHAGAVEALERLALATQSREGERFFDRAFSVREYAPGREIEIGNLQLSFAKTRHYIDAYAIRVESRGTSVVYSGDTAPCEDVVALARGAGLFICEVGLGAGGADREPRGHCSAFEAGQMARDAGALALLLTHYGAEESPEALRERAAAAYGGPIDVATDGWQLSLLPR